MVNHGKRISILSLTVTVPVGLNDALVSVLNLKSNERYYSVHRKNIIRMEENLSQALPATNHCQSTNKKGRPHKGNVINFGPQPQSIVSKSLSKIKADCITSLTNEKHEHDTIPIPICKSESDQAEDAYQKKLKRKKKTKKVKEPGKPKLFSCDFEDCSYSTKLASNMTKHKRVHTGEKPYLCDRCSFRSNFINSLNAHKRLHTEVRPYKCSECSYCCNSISNLKKHCYTRHKTYHIVYI